MTSIVPLSCSMTLERTRADVYREFTNGFGSWWPAEFSWSQPLLLHGIAMDCRLNGLLSETGPHGFRLDFGRIISWDPPSSLEFLWQISAERVPLPDPEQASIVSVEFTSTADSTTIVVTHRAWERHGAAAQDYRDAFAEAWPLALGRFKQYVESCPTPRPPERRHLEGS